MASFRLTKICKCAFILISSIILLFILNLIIGMRVEASPLNSMITENPGLLFYDDFNDGNADGWTTSGEGTWYVENHEYVVDMDSIYGNEGLSVAGDPNWTNYVVNLDMMGEEGVDKLINFRYLDGDNRYEVNLRSLFDDIWVGRVGGDGISVYFPNVNNIWYHITIFSIDERILVFVNGALVLDWSDNSGNYITHGQIGLRGWNGAKVRYDNVSVQKIVCLSGPNNGAVDTDYSFLATSIPISPTDSITYTWQSTDFPLVTHVGGITDTITYNWEIPGAKIITTTATTSYGTVTDTFPVIIDEPITGLIAINSSPTYLGDTTAFTATVSSGTDITYTWDFGDDMTGVGANITHAYSEIGMYIATVTASNNLGEISANTTVEIMSNKIYLPVIIR
jgi:hypothetical protein